MTTLITSLNKKLFEDYGRRMIEEFNKYSEDVKLIVVFEGEIPILPNVRDDHIQVVPLMNQDYLYFHQVFGKLYEANGLVFEKKDDGQGGQLLNPVWNYRFNLVKFSFKIFSILIAFERLAKGEKFAWIDADIRCQKKFSKTNLTKFFPNNEQLMSYLGRTKFPPAAPYSECGFLGFNPNHSSLMPFLDRMKSLYMTGEAFKFREWHDSWLWDEVRKEFEKDGVQFKNISGKFETTEHPFINCGLGEYFDHLKGPARKQAGKSFQTDYLNDGKE